MTERVSVTLSFGQRNSGSPLCAATASLSLLIQSHHHVVSGQQGASFHILHAYIDDSFTNSTVMRFRSSRFSRCVPTALFREISSMPFHSSLEGPKLNAGLPFGHTA